MTLAPGRRVGLRLKIVAVLLSIALAPLLASALLIGQISEVAQNFASHHVEQLRPHLTAAQEAYRDLVATKKALYEEITRSLAHSVDELVADPSALLARHADLLAVTVVAADGTVVSKAARTEPPASPHRELALSADTADGRRVDAVFAADMQPVQDLRALGDALAISQRVDTVRGALPSSYRNAFLLLVGGVVVVVTALGLLLARQLTRRIDTLVAGTRAVAGGDLEARVELSGRDELGELGAAFNTMVEDLESDRQKILYLQRIGAWQDVARRLAHEIKNPLTPIQLAVQQCVSQYDGDDPRYQRLLGDTGEIVSEEIAGLRRLVDAFSALGRLPRVEATSLPLRTVLDDLAKDPGLAERMHIDPALPELTVRADRLLLRRLVANLIENGIQAGQGAGKSGNVRVAWRADGERALITFDDEGPGVAADARDRIFEPYVTSKDTGTGLGLAIAKKIALDHRGSLEIDAEPAPTGGARFVLRLRLA